MVISNCLNNLIKNIICWFLKELFELTLYEIFIKFLIKLARRYFCDWFIRLFKRYKLLVIIAKLVLVTTLLYVNRVYTYLSNNPQSLSLVVHTRFTLCLTYIYLKYLYGNLRLQSLYDLLEVLLYVDDLISLFNPGNIITVNLKSKALTFSLWVVFYMCLPNNVKRKVCKKNINYI